MDMSNAITPKSDQLERWLPIPGYQGSYEVSNLGRVRSLDRISEQGRAIRGVVLSRPVGSSGYQQVNLHRGRRQATHLIHRLVALAFLGPAPAADMEVRHLDGNPLDNRLLNLAYGTHAENMQDQRAHGTHRNSVKTHCPSGHAYDGENLWVDKNGRRCSTCRRESWRRLSARRSAARKVA